MVGFFVLAKYLHILNIFVFVSIIRTEIHFILFFFKLLNIRHPSANLLWVKEQIRHLNLRPSRSLQEQRLEVKEQGTSVSRMMTAFRQVC